MPQITTRPATPSDFDDICAMAHALAAHHGDEATLTIADLRRDFGPDQPWGILLVAGVNDTLAGYATLCPMMQLQFGVRGMDMHHLFVKAQHRGQGVAKALISASIREAKEKACRFLTVGTDPDNIAAQNVYLAAGFTRRPVPGPRFSMKW